jgi:uncharacterized protein YjbI with pentapeptide repeats
MKTAARFRPRFGLKTLLGFILVVAVLLGCYRHFREQQRRQREFMALAAELGAKITVKPWNADERDITDPAELRLLDQIVAVDLFGYGWFPFKDGQFETDWPVPGEPDFESLIELITATVRPSSGWEMHDGIRLRRRQLAWQCLKSAKQLPALKRLSLRCGDFDDDLLDDESLASLSSLTGLEHLNLRGMRIGDVGLKHLAELTQLKHLMLGSTHVTDAGLEHLHGLTNLETLDLSGTPLGDADLSALRGMTKLKRLSLESTGVATVDLRGLMQLEQLDVSNTPLRRIEFDGADGLRVLDLSSTDISDEALQSARGIDGVERLNLFNTRVTGKGLARLARLGRLEELSVNASALDANGLGHLREASSLKAVHVTWEFKTPNGSGSISHTIHMPLPPPIPGETFELHFGEICDPGGKVRSGGIF